MNEEDSPLASSCLHFFSNNRRFEQLVKREGYVMR